MQQGDEEAVRARVVDVLAELLLDAIEFDDQDPEASPFSQEQAGR